jgi:hypothetical protein
MPQSVSRLCFIPLLVALAVGASACGSSSNSTTSATAASTAATTPAVPGSVPVVGTSTAVTVYPVDKQILANSGVTITPIAPATAKGALVFPVSGGQVTVATLSGTLQHTGGLKFTRGGKSVEMTSFIIDTTKKQVTALVNGMRVPILDLSLASVKRASGPNGTVIASGITLTVTPQTASILNTGLEVELFQAGLPFGVATVTVAVKH